MFDTILSVLTFWIPISCIVFFCIQMLYWSILYPKVAKASRMQLKGSTEYPPISVIITARNQGNSLRKNLRSILEQDYPEFEVIVVNDNSDDSTEDILVELQQSYTNLYHTFTPDSARYVSRRKLAITLGMRASKHEWLVFTNPQCTPRSNQWLKRLASHFTEKTDLVLGCYDYEPQKGYFARKVSFDAMIQQMRSLGSALMDHPYTGSGMNLAYRKSFFQRSKGFQSHLELLRGEDDLFINQTATAENTQIELSPDAIVSLPVPEEHNIWLEEKVQHIATHHYFKGIARYVMGFESVSRYLFILLAVFGIILSIWNAQWIMTVILGLLIIVRLVAVTCVIRQTSKALNSRKYLFSIPWMLFIQPLNGLNFKMKWLLRHKDEFKRK